MSLAVMSNGVLPVGARLLVVGVNDRESGEMEQQLDVLDELPGFLALQRGVMEQQWPHTMDAQIWADEWLKQMERTPEMATDKGAMISWFANAIMAGYDTAMYRASRGQE